MSEASEVAVVASGPAHSSVSNDLGADINGSQGQTPCRLFLAQKRIFDLAFCIAVFPIFVGLCVAIYLLNPFFNRGDLFFRQRRCGKDGKEFTMIKFRSMTSAGEGARGADDPLDVSRITPLGYWMRETKIDELPQIFNVLRGDMSVIGPRPEAAHFVETYRQSIPSYGVRSTVKPGITGYAQVVQGYTDNIEMVRRKTELDYFYVQNMGWRLDLVIIAKTFRLITGSALRPERA